MSVLSDTHDFHLNAGSAGSPRTDFAVSGKQAKMKRREEGRKVSDRRLGEEGGSSNKTGRRKQEGKAARWQEQP